MKETIEKRIGGRGCPACGSHDTEGLARTGAQWCMSCNHRWLPCSAHCRGYELHFSKTGPEIRGCKSCGVPDKIATWWPEAYRALSLKLATVKPKLEPVV
jgi:hypothetical protein